MAHPEKATFTSSDLKSWAADQEQHPDPMWDMIFDAIKDPIFLLSTSGELLNINTSSERFLNLSRSEILGKHCYELVHHTQTFMKGCPFAKSKISKKSEHYEFILNDRWSRISIDPILDAQGEIVGAIHVISDIHDLLAATTEMARIGKIIENTNDGILSTSVEGMITGWNHGVIRLLGYPEEILHKMNIRDLFTDTDFDPKNIAGLVQSDKPINRFEATILRENGEKVVVSIGASPGFDERDVFSGVSYIITDLTSQRKAEQELLAYITEAVLRLKKPVEIIKNNIEDFTELLVNESISVEDIQMLLRIQITNTEQVLENLAELNRAIVSRNEHMPEDYREFLSQ